MADDADMKPASSSSSSEEKEASKQESKQQDKDKDKDSDKDKDKDTEQDNDNEKDKDKEKKPKTPRKKKEATAVTPRSDRPQRERKSVDHWQPEANESFRKEFEVEEGAGTPLGEIENVKRRLEATKATESEVKKLHSILFPGAGKGNATKDVVKKHIRQFSGFPGSSAEKEKAHDAAKDKLEKIELKTLKAIAGILDVGISGSRPEIASRIADFLNKPKSSGHAYQAKVRSSSGSSKGSKKGTKRKSSTKGEKSGKKKRTKNSFMIFRADVYDEMKEKYPDLKITELASKIGEKWRGLSADKKKKYEDKAAKLKAEASDAEDDDDEKPAKKAKKSSSKKKASPKKKKASTKKKGKKEESEEDEEDEEEEENEQDEEEEEEEEEETEEDKKVKLELSLAISDIIQKADLTSMSLKKVREQLTADTAFGEEIVNKKKDIIKQLVTDAVQAKQKATAKEEKQKEKDKDADQDGDKEMEDKAEKAEE